jgi:hypothetical protein
MVAVHWLRANVPQMYPTTDPNDVALVAGGTGEVQTSCVVVTARNRSCGPIAKLR